MKRRNGTYHDVHPLVKIQGAQHAHTESECHAEGKAELETQAAMRASGADDGHHRILIHLILLIRLQKQKAIESGTRDSKANAPFIRSRFHLACMGDSQRN